MLGKQENVDVKTIPEGRGNKNVKPKKRKKGYKKVSCSRDVRSRKL